MERQLLQTLFMIEADIFPDKEKKQLRIRVHSTSRPASNKAIEKLVEQLNQTELNYPGTDMRLIFLGLMWRGYAALQLLCAGFLLLE